jgi:hypothetical protein
MLWQVEKVLLMVPQNARSLASQIHFVQETLLAHVVTEVLAVRSLNNLKNYKGRGS